MPDYTGRTAVVTGFASGIGARTTTLLAGLGARVIGVDRPGTDAPAQLRDVVAARIDTDLSTPEGPAAVAAQVDGPVHLLVNNAGVAATRPWREVLGVDLLAPRDLTRLLAPKFADAAAVVTVASQAGLRWRENVARSRALLAAEDWEHAFALAAAEPDIQRDCYAIAKESVIVDALTLAAERPVPGLRANTVSPGTVQTPLLADFRTSMGNEVVEGAAAWAGRHATPDDIAAAIAFLGSDDAAWISGVDLPVDGGYGALIFTMMQSAAKEAAL
ncbi:SDR family oxidoreductase [Tomitella gaofuii]|uniref:SDR family oxidoreductase n=1 Tax=Tomitella gaofuii TaxID=2760083 RepID=UPI0015FD927C|nr:SDR family oxidoreductase [Tomitella gaofuii]